MEEIGADRHADGEADDFSGILTLATPETFMVDEVRVLIARGTRGLVGASPRSKEASCLPAALVVAILAHGMRAGQGGGGGVVGRRTWWAALDLTVPRDGGQWWRVAWKEKGLFATDLKNQGFFCKKQIELGGDMFFPEGGSTS